MNAPIRDAFDCSSRKPMGRQFVSVFPRALLLNEGEKSSGVEIDPTQSSVCLLKLQALGKNHMISLAFTTFSLYATLTFKYAKNIYLTHEPSILPPQLLPVRIQTYRTHPPSYNAKLKIGGLRSCENVVDW